MNWQSTEYNEGVTLKAFSGGLFYFNIPTGPDHVNSLITDHGPVKLGSLLHLDYQVKLISGAPVFHSLDPNPGLPPNFRVMLQREGPLLDSGGYEHYRWWSNPEHVDLKAALENGKRSGFSVWIGRKHWSNVKGTPATEALDKFIECLAHVAHFQIVWGGGVSFSHGILATGGVARFKLFSFKVTDVES